MRKLICLCMIIIIFTSCSMLKNKKNVVIAPEEVVNAVETDNSFLLNSFFSEDFPVTYSKDGKSLLMIAIENDSHNVLDMILVRGAYLEEEIEDGRTPIFYVRSSEALNKLVIAGADINKLDNKKESVISYFIKNKPFEYSEYLVIAGANLDVENDEGWTPIFDAVVSGNIKLVELMLERGGDFKKEDVYGNIPIFYTNNEDMLLKLLEIKDYNLNMRNKKNENIFGEIYLRAVENGYVNVVKKLFELGINPYYMSYGDSAISIAKEKNNLEMIELLKSRGLK
ncbi:MAG: ankyrin repeat domain-containing protein [Fusobacterium sp.]|uniref:ankyrin repeat domain-containing protein n=1 Tax=Fusobacterium sp. TaxID=68766 RepID=UPI002943B0B5|nr:ankyrin repeat domain-containing protein [Fusobacterium sp.]MDY3059428.1 ankyrin repeat domain-containing protein [Fusobacterium sp.]